ncbi:MAG: type IX secretion system PorP/SprF family membrane protein [Limisphaerales bacterium]|jgi:type IX secretion system PorP/SprF family membrane protein
MNIKSLLTALIITCLSLSISAQDVHFSQFWASPLTLNPALAGMTPCTYRAGVNYRNQWGSVVGPSAYQTYGVFFDAGLMKGKLNGSMLGVGVNFFNDRSGDGILQNLSASGTVAYHQQFGEGHYVSVGFQAGMVQKSVDPTKFVFADMIDENGVIPGATTADILANNQFTYLDMNVGFHWTSTFSDNFTMYAGGAMFHVSEPVETFLNDNGNIINRRIVAHGGMKIGIQNKVVLLPSIIYQNQTEGANVEIIGGASAGFAVGESSNFYIGGYYRNGVDVIAITGIDFSNVQLGFSYDININDLSVVSNNKGGLEISLLYFGCLQTKDKPKRVIDCPRF